MAVVVVASTSREARFPGRLRNGEWDASIASGSTARRRAVTSASERAWLCTVSQAVDETERKVVLPESLCDPVRTQMGLA
jgi:hypothetical protein